MRFRNRGLLCALAIAAACTPGWVAAQDGEVDISTITCEQLKAQGDEALGVVLIWIDGYLGGVADDTMLDLERVKNNVAEIRRVCAESPRRGVLDIVRKYEASQVEEE